VLELFKEEWVRCSEVLKPQKFESERPSGISKDEWKLMKKRFAFKRLNESKTAYNKLSEIVLKTFYTRMEKLLGRKEIPSPSDPNTARKIVEILRTIVPDDPEFQFTLLVKSIDSYLHLYQELDGDSPSLFGYFKTMRKNPVLNEWL